MYNGRSFLLSGHSSKKKDNPIQTAVHYVMDFAVGCRVTCLNGLRIPRVMDVPGRLTASFGRRVVIRRLSFSSAMIWGLLNGRKPAFVDTGLKP